MKHLLMAVMAAVMLVVFSAPTFAGSKDEKKRDKKGGYTDMLSR